MPELFDVASYNTNKTIETTLTSTAAPGQEVVALVTPNLPAGLYTIHYSFQCTFSAKDKAIWFGLTGDLADASMFTVASTGSDELNKNRLYGYPFSHAGGVLTLGLNFYKDALLATAVIDFADIAVQRVN